MSLTSYRAAPPRVNRSSTPANVGVGNANAAPRRRGENRKEGIVLGWPGDDLLSRVLRHSTIGAEAFNGRVRDGIGFRRLAQITGPAKDNLFGLSAGAHVRALRLPRASSAGAHSRLRALGPDAPAVRPASKQHGLSSLASGATLRQGRRPPALMRGEA